MRAVRAARRWRPRWWRHPAQPVAVPEPDTELIFLDQPTVRFPRRSHSPVQAGLRVAPYASVGWRTQPILRVPASSRDPRSNRTPR
ncbi:hypothetical protein [Alloactinosynnema sp. L-07]|uniref:hypothetical protein n=1 Tax=Alloactinosynnema sp. L-07 TaxID=1653480 RepID=UPI00065F025F|nr:hypothetical protein [Alloactinosynnema sp. L-07]CRK55882.1 hypothetical protein [Alloactinosynnema sp. L-07]